MLPGGRTSCIAYQHSYFFFLAVSVFPALCGKPDLFGSWRPRHSVMVMVVAGCAHTFRHVVLVAPGHSSAAIAMLCYAISFALIFVLLGDGVWDGIGCL